MEHSGESFQTLIDDAQEKLRNGQVVEAVQVLKQVILIAPEFAASYSSLVRVAIATKDMDVLCWSLEMAEKSALADEGVILEIVIAFAALQNEQEAKNALNYLLRVNPKNPAAVAMLKG